jgi:hypothetical protein
MAGYAILLKSTDPNVRYAAIFLTASCAFFGGSLCNGQVSANTVSDTARSVAIGTNGKGFLMGHAQIMIANRGIYQCSAAISAASLRRGPIFRGMDRCIPSETA